MSNLYVTEYSGLGYVASGTDGMSYKVTAQAPLGPPNAEQKLGISGSSAASAAFNQYTRLIRVHTDVVCSIYVGGTSPSATTSSGRMAANQTEYFSVNPGDAIAVIANS